MRSILRFPLLAASLLTLALAGCVAPSSKAPPPAPTPTPAPAPTLPPPPAPAGDWQDRPLTQGDWSYRAEPGGSVALFGPSSGEALLSFRCDLPTHRILVTRAGAMPTPSAQMVVRTTFGVVQWPATTDGRTLPHTVAIRAAGDGALDQIAFSRGRFAVEAPGLASLIVPAWPEVTRVIEDCRG
jgi:hypothetical protein